MKRLEERLRAWTCRRQHLGGAGATTALEALRGVVGVYGSHPGAPLSLLARSPGMTESDFRSLDGERRALRIPAMRQSVHLVPDEMADEVFTATRAELRAQLWRLGQIGLDLDGYRTLRNSILEVTRTPASAGEIRRNIGLPGPAATGVIQTMAFEGVLLRVPFGSLRANSLKYVATDAWLGRALDHHDDEEALAALTRRYLHAFGPARPADAAWWTGRPTIQILRALASMELVEVGDDLVLLAEDEEAFNAVEPLPPRCLDVLPVWDAYTMGFAPDGRARIAPADQIERLYDDVGNGLGAVLLGGRAIAAWRSWMEGFTVHVDIDPFKKLKASLRDELTDRFESFAALLDADGVVITRSDGPIHAAPRTSEE